jgi:hypothetical protein
MKNANYTNNGNDILIEVCNYNADIRGDMYGGRADSYADFLVWFEKSNGEKYDLYLQVEMDADGDIYELGTGDCQDDYDLLPKWVDDSELIRDLNDTLKNYEKELNIEPFELAKQRKREQEQEYYKNMRDDIE